MAVCTVAAFDCESKSILAPLNRLDESKLLTDKLTLSVVLSPIWKLSAPEPLPIPNADLIVVKNESALLDVDKSTAELPAVKRN
jgi:hypothetical protein